MGYLKIYCDSCGGEWQVYHHQIHDEHTRQCPHCYARIDSGTWNQIETGFGEMLDSELELVKDHAAHKPLFTVDFVANAIYANAKKRRRRRSACDD